MRTYVSFPKAVSLQPGGSENGSLLVDEDGPDVTDEFCSVDDFGVIDAKLDRLVAVELLAGCKVNRVFDEREEGPEILGKLLVWSDVLDECDLDDEDDGSVNDELPGEIELVFASETSAVVMF